MSQENLEQFMEKVVGSEELKASIENQMDSDGHISVDALIRQVGVVISNLDAMSQDARTVAESRFSTELVKEKYLQLL